MRNDDATLEQHQTTRRHWLENLLVLGLTLCLFVAANQFDLYGHLRYVLQESNSSSTLKMRSLERQVESAPALINIDRSGTFDFNSLMSLGLVASLGLTAFAFLQ